MAQFSEDFFYGEVREGFFVESMMKRSWAAQMEVLEEIDKICKKHGIRYFADYGTLLGAVRHKGFIPWDDDMDIAMLRADYEKFIRVAPKELPEGFIVGDARIERFWANVVSRVVNGMEIGNQNKERLNRFHGFPFAAGVDIFVLDKLPSDKEAEKVQYELLLTLQLLKKRLTEQNVLVADVESELAEIEKLFGIVIDRNASVPNQLQRLTDQICGIHENEACEEITSFYYRLYHPDYRLKKEWYEECIELPFETIMMPVPKNYHEILQVIYGEDYMTPKMMLQSHEYPYYRKQEKLWYEHVAKEILRSVLAVDEVVVEYLSELEQDIWKACFDIKCEGRRYIVGVIDGEQGDDSIYDKMTELGIQGEVCYLDKKIGFVVKS